MKTLKTFDPELFAQFQKSKFVVGYHIGAIGNIITARKPVTINKLFDVSQTNELSLLEAAAVLHRDEIITLGKKTRRKRISRSRHSMNFIPRSKQKWQGLISARISILF